MIIDKIGIIPKKVKLLSLLISMMRYAIFFQKNLLITEEK